MASTARATTSPEPVASASGWLKLGALAVGAIFTVPFFYLLVENLTAEEQPFAFLDPGSLGPLWRSVALAVAVSIGATVLGTTAAWLVTRTNTPGRRIWRILLPLPLVIPSFIGAFVMIAAFAPGGLFGSVLGAFNIGDLPPVRGPFAAFIVLTLFTYPYVYLPAAARFGQLPSSLEESARLLGARPAVSFRRIVLPQARSAILAGSLLVFLYVISDFGVVQLMRYDALTRVIYSTRLFDRATSIALSLQLGVLALVVVAVERVLTKGPKQQRGARVHRPLLISLGRWRAPATGFLCCLVGLALFIPVAVLTFWAVRGITGGSTSGVLVSDVGSILRPLFNTTMVSVAAAGAAMLLVLPVVYMTVRHRSRLADVSNAVVVSGFALPGLAIALSLVYLTVSAAPLSFIYQTLPLLILAYVIHFGAQAMRAAQVALSSVPTVVDDAARVLGARRGRRLIRIELPIMTPGLASGAGLVLLSTMKELPATLLLAPAGFQTLAMKIWQATESAFFSDAAIMALVLIALSGVLTWALVIRGTEFPS
ncbi:MAG: ABC transporter permease [Actinomycetota bacterium]